MVETIGYKADLSLKPIMIKAFLDYHSKINLE